MPEALLAEDRQGCGDAVENTFEVDVDHLLPILDPQVVKQGNRPDAGVADENVELAETLDRQLDEVEQIVAPFDVRARVGGLSARFPDTVGESREPIGSARAEHNLGAAPGEQQRGRLAYAAARARDRDDFAFYAGHEDILSNRDAHVRCAKAALRAGPARGTPSVRPAATWIASRR